MLLKNQRCLCNVNTLMYIRTAMKLTAPCPLTTGVCEIILLRKMNGKSVEWQPMSLQIYANLCKMFLWEKERQKAKEKQKSDSERNHLNETLHSVQSELFILFSYRSLKNRNIFLHKNVWVCMKCILLRYTSSSFIHQIWMFKKVIRNRVVYDLLVVKISFGQRK